MIVFLKTISLSFFFFFFFFFLPFTDMTNDMMLLSHSDVIISARQSAFTQSLPLSRVFDKHEGEEGPHFCEVDAAGAHMTCLEDKKTWLFRDDVSKIIPISKGKGLNGLFEADTKQVHHKLLVNFPDVDVPKEFLDARTFLHSGRNLKQPDILKHMMGEKAIYPKYDQRTDGISQATKFNWASSDEVIHPDDEKIINMLDKFSHN